MQRSLLEQGKLQGKGPLQSPPGAAKSQDEGPFVFLALVAIIQQQAGTHTRLETPQGYHGHLLVCACHLLFQEEVTQSLQDCGELAGWGK